MRACKPVMWGAMAVIAVAVMACEQPDMKPQGTALQALPKPEIAWRPSPQKEERAPISLTASDGSGLLLVSLQARTVIEDPLAFTELRLVFHNPEPRRREGRFEITLPPAAAISRFAMRVGDELQEGEVVERRRAQQVYEDFLHRKQDPALLENDAGNEFAARVFPIEANADKEIIISYSEELTRSDEPYRLLLQGLPTLRELAVDVQVGSNSATGTESTPRARGASATLSVRQRDYAPTGDIEVRLPAQKSLALRSGDLVVARVVPTLDLKPEPITGLTVLLDTSASRALGFGAQLERLARLLAALRERMGQDFDLRVVAFDQQTQPSYRGPASGFGLREQSALLERDALGASDLSRALASLAREPAGHARVLVIGDGVITAGESDTTALREAVAKLAAHGVTRLDALAEGGIQDRATLSAITRAGLPSAGVVLDARAALGELVDALLGATQDRVQVQINGASWVYPSVLEGVQAGAAQLVFAELPEGTPLQIELVGAGAEAFETMQAPAPLVERAVARARIAALGAELQALPADASDARAALEQRIVELSVQSRVVSDYTALLVLETAADYARFGIAQNALTSILQVGNEGLTLLERKPDAEHKRDDRPPLQVARDEEPEKAEGSLASPVPERAPDPQPPTAASPGSRVRAAVAEALRRTTSDSSGSLGGIGSGSGKGGMGEARRPAAPAPAPKPSANQAADLREQDQPLDRSAAKASSNGAVAEPKAQLAIAAALEPKAAVFVRGTQGLADADVAPVVRGVLRARALRCYARAAAAAGASERLVLELAITDKGTVSDVYVASGALADRAVQACVLAAARALRFPKPGGANASLQLGLELSMQPARAPRRPSGAPRPPTAARPRVAKLATPPIDAAYTGALAEVLEALQRGDAGAALARAKVAHAQDPGDVLALVALGETLEATQSLGQAARAYGSIIDLFPSRADLRRMAGARLERLSGEAHALELAADSYRRAVEQRPDQPSGARALAFTLVKQGKHALAFEALERALARSYPVDRFEGVERILREDLALIGAAWLRAEPAADLRVRAALAAVGGEPDHAPSLRFILSWETDANDVDFHVYDGRGGHAFYQKPKLPSGGALYADITTGYGPECFAIPGRTRAYPYVLQAHYFARGPMGYGMGKLQVIEHDGSGVLDFSEHPFVIMKDKAFVELARLSAPK